MMTAIRARWQRFLDGTGDADPYADVPATVMPVPRSKVGRADPISTLPRSSGRTHTHRVPDRVLNSARPQIQERDQRRLDYEQTLGGESRAMLAQMDWVMGQQMVAREPARLAKVSAVLETLDELSRRHRRNMSRFETTNGWSAGTMFIRNHRHEPGTTPSLRETGQVAREMIQRALHVSSMAEEIVMPETVFV